LTTDRRPKYSRTILLSRHSGPCSHVRRHLAVVLADFCSGIDIVSVFEVRYHAERGYVTHSMPSVYVYIRICLWRSDMFFTQVGLLRK